MRINVKLNKSYSEEEVKKFISISLSVPLNRISEETSLFHDLGIDGDDAVDFLNEFSDYFNVNLSKFNFNDYFGAEASPTPWGFVSELITKSNFSKIKRLEIKDLIRAVKNGEFDPTIDVKEDSSF